MDVYAVDIGHEEEEVEGRLYETSNEWRRTVEAMK